MTEFTNESIEERTKRHLLTFADFVQNTFGLLPYRQDMQPSEILVVRDVELLHDKIRQNPEKRELHAAQGVTITDVEPQDRRQLFMRFYVNDEVANDDKRLQSSMNKLSYFVQQCSSPLTDSIDSILDTYPLEVVTYDKTTKCIEVCVQPIIESPENFQKHIEQKGGLNADIDKAFDINRRSFLGSTLQAVGGLSVLLGAPIGVNCNRQIALDIMQNKPVDPKLQRGRAVGFGSAFGGLAAAEVGRKMNSQNKIPLFRPSNDDVGVAPSKSESYVAALEAQIGGKSKER